MYMKAGVEPRNQLPEDKTPVQVEQTCFGIDLITDS
jgi:hypothetical protein